MRIDGLAAIDALSNITYFGDLFNDGTVSLSMSAISDYNSRSDSGSIFLLKNSIFNLSGVGNLINPSGFIYRYDGQAASDTFDYHDFADLNSDGSLDLIGTATGADNNSRSGSGSVWIIFNFPHTVNVNSFTTASGNSVGVYGTVTVSSSSVTSLSGVQVSLDNNSPSASTWTNCTAADGSFNSATENFNCTGINISALTSGKAYRMYVRAFDSNGFYTAQSNYGSFTFFKDYNPGSVVNCPQYFTYCTQGGPNFTGLNSIISGGSGTLGTVIIDKTTDHNDLYVTITTPKVETWDPLVPLPWSQGFNTVSDILNFNGLSAFNGYPIVETDNPFVIQLEYDPTKLQGRSPSSLTIIHYDQSLGRWVSLLTPMIIDEVNHTISTTTNLFGLFAVAFKGGGYETETATTVIGKGLISKTKVVKTTTTTPKKTVQPQKTCFLWWCW